MTLNTRSGTAIAATIIMWPLLVNGLYNPLLLDHVVTFWVTDLFTTLVLPVACLAFIYFKAGIKPSDYGLAKPKDAHAWTSLVLTSALALFVLYVARFPLSAFTSLVLETPLRSTSVRGAVPEGYLFIPAALYVSLTAGVLQEIAFRGLPWEMFKTFPLKRVREIGYVALTSVLFAAVNWENGTSEMFAIFVYGVVAACLYLRWKTLWPLVIAHVLIDLSAYLGAL